MGSDLSIINAARVSFHKESEWEIVLPLPGTNSFRFSKLSEKDKKLLSYLAKHGHWSPFAHTSLQFRIKAPIFVARQLVKHQVGGTWNEVSRRYVDEEPEFWFPEVWRGKPVNAKQGSSGTLSNEVLWTGSSHKIVNQCLVWYEEAIKEGMAPEQARMILPQNTMTEWIWTGSLMFFARVCKQRLDSHAQEETQQIAQQISNLIPKEFEHSWKVLMQS